MIVVNAQETKEPSGLSQLLLGKKGAENSQFSKFLKAFDLNTVVENEDFNLETALEKIITPKEGAHKTIDSNLIVTESKNTKIPVSEKIVISNHQDTKTLLKETTLLHLLQGESIETSEVTPIKTALLEDSESQFLHPKMINMLEPKDIKLVVNAAKNYLKEQIDVIIKEQNIDVKSMPQTLKGLSDMAKKLGVNLEKITLDHIALPKIQEQTKTLKEPLPLLDMKKQEIPTQVASIRTAFIPKESLEVKKQEPLQKALHVKNTETIKTEPLAVNTKTEALHVRNTETIKIDSLAIKSTDNIKTEPLHVKSNDILKTEPVYVKTTSDKQSKAVKIGTTKVVVPTLETENLKTSDTVEVAKVPIATKPLSELLYGETDDKSSDQVSVKITSPETKVSQSSFINIPASDSLEVKAKEAQQMVRHIATDIKEAVENYKPPFTRLKMTLNPAKLGEVDVTLIQRGNNVHINISSNNTAVTLLSQNITELKTQLANNGVVNTSMQFSTSHGEHQQQEGRHQQFQSYKDIEQLSEEELEIITSMEIILPRYV